MYGQFIYGSLLVLSFIFCGASFGKDFTCRLQNESGEETISLHIRGIMSTVTYNREGQPELSTICVPVSNVGHRVCEPVHEDPSFAYFFLNFPWQEMSVVTNGPYMQLRKYDPSKKGSVFPCAELKKP
jgi:hypothetical protein